MTAANVWLVVAIVGFVLSGLSLIAAIVVFIKLDILSVIGFLTGKNFTRGVKRIKETNKADSGVLNTDDSTGSTDDKSAMSYAHASKQLDKNSSKLTGSAEDKKSKSGRINKNPKAESTEILPENNADNVLESFRGKSSEGTEVLDNSKRQPNATEVLDSNERQPNATEVLDSNERQPNATEVLDNSERQPNATEVLDSNERQPNATEVLDSNERQPNETEVFGNNERKPNETEVLDENKKETVNLDFCVTDTIILTDTDEVI